jgi:hypothetical protein
MAIARGAAEKADLYGGDGDAGDDGDGGGDDGDGRGPSACVRPVVRGRLSVSGRPSGPVRADG